MPSMRSMRRMRVALAASVVALAGCNAIFGIDTGEVGSTDGTTTGTTTTTGTGATGGTGGTGGTTAHTGGTGGTGGTPTGGSSTGGTGGTGGAMCDQYEGDGTIQWTDLGGANLPEITLGTGDSVSAHYDVPSDATYISMGGYASGICVGGAGLVLSGPPIVGQVYTPVDKATYDNFDAFHQGKNAFVDTGVTPQDANGDCLDPGEKKRLFTSTAGVGEVKVTSLNGIKLAFTGTGLVVVADPDPMYGGTGTVGVEILGFANCYYDGM